MRGSFLGIDIWARDASSFSLSHARLLAVCAVSVVLCGTLLWSSMQARSFVLHSIVLMQGRTEC